MARKAWECAIAFIIEVVRLEAIEEVDPDIPPSDGESSGAEVEVGVEGFDEVELAERMSSTNDWSWRFSARISGRSERAAGLKVSPRTGTDDFDPEGSGGAEDRVGIKKVRGERGSAGGEAFVNVASTDG